MTRATDLDESRTGRYWEVDLLRGIAVVMMIAFHALYDLDFFSSQDLVDVHSGVWSLFAKATASIFLLLVGVSLNISSARARFRGEDRFFRYFRRGVGIFSWGMAITLSTMLLLGEGFVVFGVLHLIGISIILSYPFLNRGHLDLFLGSVAIFIGLLICQFSFKYPWFLWLGLVPRHFYSVDYFPLLPWFGVVLVGISLGNFLYPDGARKVRLPDPSTRPPAKQICSIGRNSLAIYLIHQPILIILMQLFGIVEVGKGLVLHMP